MEFLVIVVQLMSLLN